MVPLADTLEYTFALTSDALVTHMEAEITL